MNIGAGVLLGQYILARLQLADGEMDGMRKTCQEGRQLAAQLDRGSLQGAWFAALEAQASLQQGDIAAAARWAEAAGLTSADAPHHWKEPVYFTYVRFLLAQEQLEGARTLLATMERSAQQGGRNRALITIHLQQALVERATGRERQAFARVEKGLRLAAPEDYRRAFLDEGQAIVDLLPPVRHVALAFVDSLLEAFRDEMRRMQGEVRPSVSLIEPLTERELEILRLIAAGRSNPEIADLLYLSLNTVKWHVRNLYGKLGVSNRVAAAARAQELGLLQRH
jgi:LuxR family maltose regulon positive regulatory protein